MQVAVDSTDRVYVFNRGSVQPPARVLLFCCTPPSIFGRCFNVDAQTAVGETVILLHFPSPFTHGDHRTKEMTRE